MKQCWGRSGSYTVEAAFVLPLILFALTGVMGLGFETARSLRDELQLFRQSYVETETEFWPEILRKEQALVDGFWEE